MLRLKIILKEILFSLVESPTYKPTVPRRAERQQFPLPTFSWHAYIATQILSKTAFKPTVWKHYIADDIFLPLGKSKSDIVAEFLRTSKLHHPTLILNSRPKYLYRSDTETVILLTVVYTKAQDSRKSYP